MKLILNIISIFISITEAYISTLNQYHIQTDTGNERFFKFKTQNGQYRKERRLSDGTVTGLSSWIDANGNQHVQEYKADQKGYHIVKSYTEYVGTTTPTDKSTTTTTTTHKYSDRLRRKQQMVKFKKHLYKIPQDFSTTTTTTTTVSTVTKTKRKRIVIKRKPLIMNLNEFKNKTNIDSNDYSSDPIYDHKTTNSKLKINKWKQRRNIMKSKSKSNILFVKDKRQFHFQQNNQDKEMIGQYGYIDPFGIRRIVYYYASPKTGYLHQKRNQFIGLNN